MTGVDGALVEVTGVYDFFTSFFFISCSYFLMDSSFSLRILSSGLRPFKRDASTFLRFSYLTPVLGFVSDFLSSCFWAIYLGAVYKVFSSTLWLFWAGFGASGTFLATSTGLFSGFLYRSILSFFWGDGSLVVLETFLDRSLIYWSTFFSRYLVNGSFFGLKVGLVSSIVYFTSI